MNLVTRVPVCIAGKVSTPVAPDRPQWVKSRSSRKNFNKGMDNWSLSVTDKELGTTQRTG